MITAEQMVELKEDRYVMEMEDLDLVVPKVERLLKNNHVGIALKRFVNREIEYVEGITSLITSKSTHVLRVESKKNRKRFNAVINYEPISFFPSGTVEKNNWPYQIIIDRRVPWSILLQHKEGHSWLDLKCRIERQYKIIESYGL
jgi:hypothetical protein